MNKIILAKNRKVEFPKRIKLIEPDNLNTSIYDLEFEPGLITESGTNIDADLINLIQKNTFIDLKCEKLENTEVNSNLQVELEGINTFSVFQGMKIILLMNLDSVFDKPLQISFIDNNEESNKYPIKLYNNGHLETLNNMPKGIYQLIYIDNSFIVISSGSESKQEQNSSIILWQGTKYIADGDYVNCNLENIFASVNIDNCMLVINIVHDYGVCVDIMIPSATLTFGGFNIAIPVLTQQNESASILSNVKRINDDLIFTSDTYTVYPGSHYISKVTLIK